MSFFRMLLVALVAVFGFVAINANAADNSAAQASQNAQAEQSAPASGASQAAHHKADMAKVDLNAADAATLAKVKGIGARKAKAIIAYRTKNGSFQSVEDLKNITNAKGKPLFKVAAIEKLEKSLTIGATS